MAWLAKDKNGEEYIYEYKPERGDTHWQYNEDEEWKQSDYVSLPIGTIKKLIGRELKWEDEPVCISDGETVKDVSTELIVYAQQKAVGYFNKTLPNFKLNCLKQQFIDDRVNIINAYVQGVIDAFNDKK